MYNPISCEFFDQLNVAMQRKIPSTIVYLKDEDNKLTSKGTVKTMEVIEGIEYLILDSKERIRLDTVLTFNGKKHREE
ncbi:MAG: transcriptional antiterminator Rof [Arcobacter sp.]|nr:transcriptional antiterminator Rof [Arcobacter sp.]|tara:strand:+ start:5259 stop:5492 length:234 start_codon:yes stop_codon:yes gene_type:complete